MYSLTSGTYLFHLFSCSACILLPLTHTYFIFFLFSHVFLCLWHIPISSFFFFRMCSFASGTYLFHLFSFSACIPLPLAHTQSIISPSRTCIPLPLAHTYFTFFLFPHVFLCFWHIPISSFFFFRMYSFASGTYPIHNFPSLACIPLPLVHTYFIFFLFSHVFSYLWHIPNP